MHSGRPIVSIVVPTYNGERFLDSLIDNVCKQSLHNFELLIVVDASEDNSEALIRKRQKSDERVNLIMNSKNMGASYCRNVGMSRATGQYVAFLDHDDLWHSQKLSRQVTYLENNYSVVAVMCNYAICESGSKGLRPLGAFWYRDVGRMYVKWLNLRGDGPLLPSTLMLRNIPNIPRFNEKLRALYDLDYCQELMKVGRVENQDDFLTIYVQHDSQMHRDASSVLELCKLPNLTEEERNRLALFSAVYSKLLSKDSYNFVYLIKDLRLAELRIVTQILLGVLRRRLQRRIWRLIFRTRITELISATNSID